MLHRHRPEPSESRQRGSSSWVGALAATAAPWGERLVASQNRRTSQPRFELTQPATSAGLVRRAQSLPALNSQYIIFGNNLQYDTEYMCKAAVARVDRVAEPAAAEQIQRAACQRRVCGLDTTVVESRHVHGHGAIAIAPRLHATAAACLTCGALPTASTAGREQQGARACADRSSRLVAASSASLASQGLDTRLANREWARQPRQACRAYG